MNRYEKRKADRVSRLRGAGEKLIAEGAERQGAAMKVLEIIPLGQPIIGAADRSRREKLHARLRRGHEVAEEGRELLRRAAAAESNKAISSDDPDAIQKLRAQLVELEEEHERDKGFNKIILAEKRKGGEWQARAIEQLVAAGLPAPIAKEYTEPDLGGRVGIPSYSLSNRSANMRRIKDRIEGLEKKATSAPPPDEAIGPATISEDREANRVLVTFPSRTTPEQHAAMRRGGFLWARSRGAYVRHASPQAWFLARQLLTKMFPPPAPPAAPPA